MDIFLSVGHSVLTHSAFSAFSWRALEALPGVRFHKVTSFQSAFKFFEVAQASRVQKSCIPRCSRVNQSYILGSLLLHHSTLSLSLLSAGGVERTQPPVSLWYGLFLRSLGVPERRLASSISLCTDAPSQQRISVVFLSFLTWPELRRGAPHSQRIALYPFSGLSFASPLCGAGCVVTLKTVKVFCSMHLG